jgi:DNA-directed RNA polymerase specialized sigma24 family protein
MVEHAQIAQWASTLRDKAVSAARQRSLARAAAEDVAQWTFEILLRRAPGLEPDLDRLCGYVWKVAYNLAGAAASCGSLQPLVLVDPCLLESLLHEGRDASVDAALGPDGVALRAELRQTVLDLLRFYVKRHAGTRYTRGQRYRALRDTLLVARCYLREKPLEEAALELGLKPEAAKKALKRTVTQLQRFVDRQSGAPAATVQNSSHFRSVTELSQFLRAQLDLSRDAAGS